MSSGGTYISNKFKDGEEYDPVEGYSVNTREGTIPSGASIVQGIYYMWNDGGFTGKGWMHGINGGPTNIYPDFHSDEDVAEYVAANGNLDAVFSHWAQHYTLEGWDKFYDAVGVNSGCMDVHHPST